MELLKPLYQKTLDRFAREWDGKPPGNVEIIAATWPKPDGTCGDAIHVIVDGELEKVITHMNSDLVEKPI